MRTDTRRLHLTLTTAAALTVAPVAAEWTRLPVGFTRVYEGEIERLPVRLTLTKKGQQLKGSYVYTRVGKPLQLQGTIDGTGAFTLDEFDGAGVRTGGFSGEFQGPTRLEGGWSKPGAERNIHFWAYEALRKPTDATGPFSGHYTLGGPQEGPGFSLDLFQRGPRIEGLYHAITRNASRLDTDSVVVGSVRGEVATVRWTSGYSGVQGTATLRRQGNRLVWTIIKPPPGEYWAPRKATLTRSPR